MALSFASNSLHLASWGFSVGDIAAVSGAGRAIITWMTAPQRDKGLLEYLNTVPTGLGLRKGLVDTEILNRRWGRELSLLRNGRRKDYSFQGTQDKMDNLDRFTWIMTLLVTCLDQAVSNASLVAIVTELALNIFADKDNQLEYLQLEVPQHIEGWRSIGCVRKMSIRASEIWQRLGRERHHLPGFVPESDCDEIVRTLVWLVIGTTASYATSSGDAFSVAKLLQEMGVDLLRTGTMEEQFDESTIVVRLDTNAISTSKKEITKDRSGMRIPLLALGETVSLWPGTDETNNRRREVFMLGQQAASGIDFATRGVESSDDHVDPERWILAFSTEKRPLKRVPPDVYSFARQYLLLPTQATFDVLHDLNKTWKTYHAHGAHVLDNMQFINMPPDLFGFENLGINNSTAQRQLNTRGGLGTWKLLGEVQIFLLGYYYTALAQIVDTSQMSVVEACGSWSWYDSEIVKFIQRCVEGGQELTESSLGKGREYKREHIMALIGRLYAGTSEEQASFVRPETAGIISKLTVLTPGLLGDADNPERIRQFVLLDTDSTSIPSNGAGIVNAANPLKASSPLSNLLSTTTLPSKQSQQLVTEEDPDFTSHIEPAWGYDPTLCTVTFRYRGRLVHKANPLRCETLVLRYWTTCSKFHYCTDSTSFLADHNCSTSCATKGVPSKDIGTADNKIFTALGPDWDDMACHRITFAEYCNRSFHDTSHMFSFDPDQSVEEMREALRKSKLNAHKCHIYWVPTKGKGKARSCIASMYTGNVVRSFSEGTKQFNWGEFSSVPIVVQQTEHSLLVLL